MQFTGLGVPNKYFAEQKWSLYIRRLCLLVLWSLSTCPPILKIILQVRPSVFKFNLKRTVIFLHKNCADCASSLTLNEQIFLKKKFVSGKTALIHLISHQTGPITSGFEYKKRNYQFLKIKFTMWYNFSMVCSRKPEASLPLFYNQKPEVRPPKKSCMNVLI